MDRVDFVSPVKFNLKCLYVFGIWLTSNESLLYKIYGYSMQMIHCYTYTINLCLMLYYGNDLESFMLSFTISLTMIGFLLKCTNIHIKRNRINDFLTILNSDESQMNNEEELDIVRRANKDAKALSYFYFGIFCVAGVTAISPIISSDPKVPYPILYPDWHKGADTLYVSCGYQFFCVLVASLSNGVTDSFISIFMVILSGLADALRHKLSNLKQARNKDDRLFREEFIECVRRHKHLLRLASELRNILSVVTFAHIFLSGVIVCGILFQLSLLSPLQNPKIFFKLTSFAAAIFIQIFIPCYTANELRIKSEKLKFTIYSSDWIETSEGTKKMIVIFTERLQHPILIGVGGTFVLGMDKFMVVLRFSYSLYSLLRRVNSQ